MTPDMDMTNPEDRKQLAIDYLRAQADELASGRFDLAFYDSHGWIEMKPGDRPQADVAIALSVSLASCRGFPEHLPPREVERIKTVLEDAMCDIRHPSAYQCIACGEIRCWSCDRLRPHREEMKTAVRGCAVHAREVIMGQEQETWWINQRKLCTLGCPDDCKGPAADSRHVRKAP